MDPVVRIFLPYVSDAYTALGVEGVQDDTTILPLVAYLTTGWLVYTVGALVTYFSLAPISFIYYFVWNRATYFPGPKDLPPDNVLYEQVREEIKMSVWAFPFMALLTLPFNLFEFYEMDYHYDDIEEYGW
eukprot:CAMPEP_0119121184 /NCGR_PEP_ID=MMETSP1310-20130426/1933_1 /TAXON_ID=464262 /ORGANISM="Genus nov. species nov., Strain RCC2339" /LENGTH=129 /DNA_ID=CAMNT_0007110733 /DNA_START=101 /DNA_END=487 /DNA_ORIENTATION=+